MAKKGYTPEQLINKLREAEILLSQGETITVISKKSGTTIGSESISFSLLKLAGRRIRIIFTMMSGA